MPRPSAVFDFIHDFSVKDTKSNPVQVPAWVENVLLFVPALATNCVVTMELIEIEDVTVALLAADNDTSWKAVKTEGEATQIVASGIEDCWIDITEYVQSCPPNCFIRFVMASAQNADSDWIIVYRGR